MSQQTRPQDNGTRSTTITTTITRTTTTDAQPILKLKAPEKSADQDQNQVQWSEETVNNEHLNRKKSKVCCIYHPQRNFDDPSDTSDSSDSSDDSQDENESKMTDKKQHKHDKCCKKSQPNAYEVQPKYKKSVSN
ncbi:unnamed protein product [Candida verbasci]|uniref:Type 1 phosphatases regulator n=1 Tax=Candida verbasci TaxID=1227364 RepID=A0A9W4TVS5_9ASCO|nr:unnamed protein product [Candida verbasci]